MSLKIKNADYYTTLENIRFNTESKCFEISSLDNKTTLTFEYKPNIPNNTWVPGVVHVFLLDSEYKNAENDVFSIKIDELEDGERLGWVFPIEVLESNDSDFANDDIFNCYRQAAYHSLLTMDFEVNHDTSKISDIYKNKIICVLHRETVKKIPAFDITNYIISLYKYGYLYSSSNINYPEISTSFKNLFIENNNYTTIKLSKSKFNITSDEFTKSLFMKGLINQENILIRFIFLYQIIEHFITIYYDNSFQNCLNEYINGTISKNDFREKINSCSEKNSINHIITTSIIDTTFKQMFLDKHKIFCQSIGQECKKDFAHCIYQFRNIIVHNIRNTVSKENEMKELVEIFEQIIIDILMSYPNNQD